MKKKYNLSLQKKVLLIAANYLYHKRKGISVIFESLAILRNRKEDIIENVELFIVGHDLEEIKIKLPQGFSFVYAPYVERKYLPKFYNVADMFISASLQDVWPLYHCRISIM